MCNKIFGKITYCKQANFIFKVFTASGCTLYFFTLSSNNILLWSQFVSCYIIQMYTSSELDCHYGFHPWFFAFDLRFWFIRRRKWTIKFIIMDFIRDFSLDFKEFYDANLYAVGNGLSTWSFWILYLTFRLIYMDFRDLYAVYNNRRAILTTYWVSTIYNFVSFLLRTPSRHLVTNWSVKGIPCSENFRPLVKQFTILCFIS